MGRRLTTLGKRSFRRIFELGQHVGVDVLPRHFYSAVPDIRELRHDSTWRAPFSMVGVQGSSTQDQLSFVKECCTHEIMPRLGRATEIYDEACMENAAIGYGPVEGLFLYCFIASQRPAKIIQVGAGVSTAIILRAARDVSYRPHIVCVDPYPTAMLQAAARQEKIELIRRRAQEVDLGRLTTLDAGDLMFIDSTHTVKPGSEVSRLMLEVLPRLSRGVFVHFHDIYLPYDYSPTLLRDDLFFWTESVLLHAFLCGNQDWRLRVSLSMVHHRAAEALRAAIPGYVPAGFDGGTLSWPPVGNHFPSAAYLQRTA